MPGVRIVLRRWFPIGVLSSCTWRVSVRPPARSASSPGAGQAPADFALHFRISCFVRLSRAFQATASSDPWGFGGGSPPRSTGRAERSRSTEPLPEVLAFRRLRRISSCAPPLPPPQGQSLAASLDWPRSRPGANVSSLMIGAADTVSGTVSGKDAHDRLRDRQPRRRFRRRGRRRIASAPTTNAGNNSARPRSSAKPKNAATRRT